MQRHIVKVRAEVPEGWEEKHLDFVIWRAWILLDFKSCWQLLYLHMLTYLLAMQDIAKNVNYFKKVPFNQDQFGRQVYIFHFEYHVINCRLLRTCAECTLMFEMALCNSKLQLASIPWHWYNAYAYSKYVAASSMMVCVQCMLVGALEMFLKWLHVSLIVCVNYINP